MTEEKEEKKAADAEPPQGFAKLPKPEFAHLIESFGTQALIYLGKIANPISNKVEKNLDFAKYQIGLLEVLEEKCKGNLNDQEQSLLGNTLHTVRMIFIDVEKEEDKKKNEETQSK